MALELRQQLKLTQQLIMTPQLQMAIKLLQLSRLELLDTIQQELEENPALEELQESAGEERLTEAADQAADDGDPAKEVTIEEKINDDIDWSRYLDEYNTPGRVNYEGESREAPKYDAFIARKESLKDHLLWQLLMTSPSREEEQVGSLIVGNLNQDGYLDIDLEEIARIAETDLPKVESVLALMQTFDPIGVCARDLSECLMIQAKHLKIDDSLVTEIIKNHLGDLEKRNIKVISRALKVGTDSIIAAVNIIKSLEPRPGRQYSDDTPQYITPDIYVYKIDNEFVIVLNDDGMPKLRVNPFYKKSITAKDKLPGEAESYIQDKLRSAAWLDQEYSPAAKNDL